LPSPNLKWRETDELRPDPATRGVNGLIERREHTNIYDLTPTGNASRSSTPRFTTGS